MKLFTDEGRGFVQHESWQGLNFRPASGALSSVELRLECFLRHLCDVELFCALINDLGCRLI